MNVTKQEALDTLKEQRLVAVIRLHQAKGVYDVVESLRLGGVRCIEITMTVPSAVSIIRHLANASEGMLIGAGTVLTPEEVSACVRAGASFIVSPVFLPEIVRKTRELGCVAIPGAITPTEVVNAWRSGADLVKIFPASRFGAQFVADLRGPLPNIPLMATGGITDQNAVEYLAAGVDVVCVGSWLTNPSEIASGKFAELTDRARRVVSVARGFTKMEQ